MLGKTVSPRTNNLTEQFIRDGGEIRKVKTRTLFTLKGNPQLNKESFIFSEASKYPYFTRTIFNNGIYGYVDYLDEAHLIKGNSLAVGMMAMQFFYMSHDFYAGQFTKTAFPLFEGFDEKVALWFISWFNKSSKRYQSLLVRDFENAFYETELYVPYKDGKVAVDFIRKQVQELEKERVRELEKERMREIEAYLKAAGFDNCTLTKQEREAVANYAGGGIRNENIKINQLFNIATGRDIIISNTTKGKIPLISHQHDNNGISKYIGQIAERRVFDYETTIPLADRGVFFATTQASNFHIGTRVKALTFKRGKETENIRLYFVAAINKLQILFIDYLTNATNNLPNLSISLPITESGDIDYNFMETYISAIKKQTIARLQEFIKREKQAYLIATK